MTTTLRVPPARRVTDLLFVIVLSLIALSTLGQAAKYLAGHPKVKGFVPVFYVDYESNIPTWYSSVALFFAACLLSLIAYRAFCKEEKYRFHWGALAGVFFLLSADEVSMLHELPIDPLRNAFQFGGMLYYPWVIPAFFVVAILGISYFPMVWKLPSRIRNLMLLAGFTFLLGALGVEMLSGANADRWGEENLSYALIITLEEFLEMLGIVIFIRALLEYVQLNGQGLAIVFAPPTTAQHA